MFKKDNKDGTVSRRTGIGCFLLRKKEEIWAEFNIGKNLRRSRLKPWEAVSTQSQREVGVDRQPLSQEVLKAHCSRGSHATDVPLLIQSRR